jgi:hypothetical protein
MTDVRGYAAAPVPRGRHGGPSWRRSAGLPAPTQRMGASRTKEARQA